MVVTGIVVVVAADAAVVVVVADAAACFWVAAITACTVVDAGLVAAVPLGAKAIVTRALADSLALVGSDVTKGFLSAKFAQRVMVTTPDLPASGVPAGQEEPLA